MPRLVTGNTEGDNVDGKEYAPAKMVVNADELVGYKEAKEDANNFEISNVKNKKKM